MKLSQKTFFSLIICNFFFFFTISQFHINLIDFRTFYYFFWRVKDFLAMPKLLVFPFIKYILVLFFFSSNNILSFSWHLLDSSPIDWCAAGQCFFNSYLRVSILHNKRLLSTTFDNNLAREVLYSFFFGEDVVTVIGIPRKYSIFIYSGDIEILGWCPTG